MHKFSAQRFNPRFALSRFTASIFPSQCLLCARSLKGDLVCVNCQYDLPHCYGLSLCLQCGLRIESLDNLCGHCVKQPPAFSRSYIPFAYEHPIDHLIHKFKYRRNLTSGKLLGQMLVEYLKHHGQEQTDWVSPDLILPAPMHWLRRWQRGFNQAEILAGYVAQELSIPVATRIVKRRYKTPAQKELSRSERQKNLRQAFAISTKDLAQVKGKNIAIVDDVVTTTATVRELSQLLLKAGARDIQVWALARTM